MKSRTHAPTQLLTYRDAANLWRVSERTIRRLVDNGKIAITLLPSSGERPIIRIHPDDLEKAVEHFAAYSP